MIRFPRPLMHGDTIAVTASSSGVNTELQQRFDFCKREAEARGFVVREGTCLRGGGIVSASKKDRASELTAMLCDSNIAAVIPPWGGELAIELLENLDWDRICRSSTLPWLVGWSDISTLLLPFTLLSHHASLHGINFMDLPMQQPVEFATWDKVLTLAAGTTFEQRAHEKYATAWTPYQDKPDVTEYQLTENSAWKVLNHENDASVKVKVRGRMIGGCLDTITFLAGSKFGNVEKFGAEHSDDGLIVYLENCETNPLTAARMFHAIRLNNWFKYANAILIGRCNAADDTKFSHRDSINDALGDLGIPVIYDCDFGHRTPQMLLVNGALAEVECSGNSKLIRQSIK